MYFLPVCTGRWDPRGVKEERQLGGSGSGSGSEGKEPNLDLQARLCRGIRKELQKSRGGEMIHVVLRSSGVYLSLKLALRVWVGFL